MNAAKKFQNKWKKNICKIKIGEEQGTGFFCKIPFSSKDNLLTVFITNNHIINKDILDNYKGNISLIIKEEETIKKISLNNRIKYTSEKYDTTIIEVKGEDNIKNYLELDDIMVDNIINNKNKYIEFIDKTIYIIQYPDGVLSVSYGLLNNICEDKKYTFDHKCSTKGGSSGSPILCLNNKVIGIHKQGAKAYNLGSFLDYPIKEFINKYYYNKKEFNINNFIYNSEEAIKAFNEKYKISIKDANIEILDLTEGKLGNKGFEYLCNIEFKGLKKLYLNINDISDIKALEYAKFENLETLNLDNNNIEEISVLERANLKQLKELYLCDNQISDLGVLSKAQIQKLEILCLSDNKINDISILEKVNFEELRQLYLDNKLTNYDAISKKNNISDIRVLEKVKFTKLEVLSFGNNDISDINILAKVNFPELKLLVLKYNKISDISVLGKLKFDKLEVLSLGNNKISDISVFSGLYFKSLKKLYLEDNNIKKIEPLDLAKFDQLERLNIYNNKIDDDQGIALSSLRSKIKDVCFYNTLNLYYIQVNLKDFN